MNIKDYYNNYDEENRLLSRYGMVEFATTMNYIEKYLTPNAKIIEIGAGTGRYSHTLAQKGYTVDAVELVEHKDFQTEYDRQRKNHNNSGHCN